MPRFPGDARPGDRPPHRERPFCRLQSHTTATTPAAPRLAIAAASRKPGSIRRAAMSERSSADGITILDWKPIRKNTLRGFTCVKIERVSFRIDDMAIHQKGSSSGAPASR